MLSCRQPEDPLLCRDDLSDLLLHALFLAQTPEDLSRCLDVSGDLAGRILHELPFYDSFSGFNSRLKTKNYTYTRISRALLHIVLDMTCEDMMRFDERHGLCGWIRPIGFRRAAAPLLRRIASESAVPFLDKLARAGDVLSPDLSRLLMQEIRAEFLYDLLAAGRSGMPAGGVKPGPAKPLVII
jgi:predicted nucleotidyltransferase